MITRYSFLRGALLIVAAELMFSSMGAVVRHLSLELDNAQIVFFRNLFSLLMLLPLMLRRGRIGFKTALPHYHLLRGLAGVGAMYCFFYALSNMPLANAMLLKMTAPLFIPIVALLWLKETLTRLVVGAVVVGFGGVALILLPDFETLGAVGMVALFGGLLAAVAKTTVRKLSATEPTALTVFYFGLTGTLISALPLPIYWHSFPPSTFIWLLLLAGFGLAGQLLMTRGYAHGKAGRLGIFSYFSVVFAAIFGWWFWEEMLTWNTVVGSVVIAVAALLASREFDPAPDAMLTVTSEEELRAVNDPA